MFLNVLVGGSCQLTCPYCLSWRQDIDQLPAEKWENFFRDLGEWLPGRNLSLSGGEPLLHPGIERIIKAAGDAGLKANICTAGDQLTADNVRTLTSLPLDGITISIDGPKEIHDKLRGQEGLFDRVMGYVDYAKELKPELQIVSTTVISKHNLDRLKELTLSLLAKPQIDQVSFQAVTSQSDPDQKWVPPQELPHFPDAAKAGDFLDWLMVQHEKTGRIKNSKRQVLVWKKYFESPKDIRALMDICHIGNYTLTVAPNGNVRLCDFYEPVGNVAESSVREIWFSEKADAVRSKMRICSLFCNFLINCGFEDFHLRLLNKKEQREYFASLERQTGE